MKQVSDRFSEKLEDWCQDLSDEAKAAFAEKLLTGIWKLSRVYNMGTRFEVLISTTDLSSDDAKLMGPLLL